MYRKQAGFTLIEIAIVLVIIGLLLGGVLKGQELINSAKVKNFAQDFRNIPLFIYGYQDKFKALPGDDARVVNNVTGSTLATTPVTSGGNACPANICQGNGVIDGLWDSTTATDESFLFWQHVRLSGLAAGPTATADANYRPRNADGGVLGIEAGIGNGTRYILNFSPTYLVCSSAILGKYAKQLDTTLDDGATDTGSVRVVTNTHVRGAAAEANAAVNDSASYIVCMGL